MQPTNKFTYLKGIGYSMIARIFAIGASFLFNLFIANYLAPADFGIYSYVISIVLLIPGVLGIASFINTIVRYVSESKSKSIFIKILKYEFAIVFVLSIVLFFGSDLIASLLGKDISIHLKVASFIVLVVPFYQSFSGVLRAFKEFKKLALSEVLSKGLFILFSAIALFGLGYHINGLIAAYILSYVLSLAFVYYCYRKLPFEESTIDEERVKKYFSWGLAASALRKVYEIIFVGFYGFFLSATQLGYFSIAQRAGFVTAIILSSIAQTLFPFASEFSKDKERIAKYASSSVKILLLISSGIFLIIVLFANWGLETFFPKYIEALPIVLLMSASQIFVSFSVTIDILNAIEKRKVVFCIYVMNLTVYLILGYFLISNYSLLGTAITILIVNIVNGIVPMLLLRMYGIKIDLKFSKEDFILAGRIIKNRGKEKHGL